MHQSRRTYLVTGGCGFIGSNLVPRLLNQGASVRVLDNFSRGDRRLCAGLGAEIVEGDIRDRSLLKKALRDVETVIHLAAYGSVVESIADPVENFDINARGTFEVLDVARRCGVQRFALASTGGALIGDAKPPVSEDSLPRPISPYGASKLCGEAYCHAFAKSYCMRTISLRFANVYGPNSAHKAGVITRFFKAVLRDEPFVIYGDGLASRDFMYVDDLCQGIVSALESESEPGEVFHLASGAEISVIDVARAVLEVVGRPDHLIEYRSARRGEVYRNFASYEKAHAAFNYSPGRTLRDGLRATWEWFLRNKNVVLSS